ncbi:unnamed protein product, partial [Musa acuminata var. zebrina]
MARPLSWVSSSSPPSWSPVVRWDLSFADPSLSPPLLRCSARVVRARQDGEHLWMMLLVGTERDPITFSSGPGDIYREEFGRAVNLVMELFWLERSLTNEILLWNQRSDGSGRLRLLQ